MKLHLLNESPEYKAAVAIVYDGQDRILVGLAKTNDDRNGKWAFPGGGIKNESPIRAAERECLEETGCRVEAQKSAFSIPKKPGVAFVVCRYKSGESKPNSEFKDIKWVPINQLRIMDDFYKPNLNALSMVEYDFT